MHLFVIDQYISFNMMAPIIYKLSKKNKKIFFLNFNKTQSFEKIELYKFITKQKNVFEVKNLIKIISLKGFFFLFVKIIMLMPSIILKRGLRFWRYVWKDVNFISKDMLIKFIKENKIQTISYDESLVENKQDFIIDISKKLRIPLLMNHGGLYTVRTKLKKKKFKFFNKCDFFLSPNKYPIYFHSLDKDYVNSEKFKLLGSPRYDAEWLEILKKIHKNKKNLKKDKIKIGLFLRPTSINHHNLNDFIKKINQLDNVEVKLNYKPRDVLPSKCSSYKKSDMEASEIILWSDIIISYASSIILEAILRDKPLIFLEFIKTNTIYDKSWFDNFTCIKKAKNTKDIFRLILNFKSNKNKLNITSLNKQKILQKFIFSKTGKGILNRYYYFYNNLTKIKNV